MAAAKCISVNRNGENGEISAENIEKMKAAIIGVSSEINETSNGNKEISMK
jgi:hypothetical protein